MIVDLLAAALILAGIFFLAVSAVGVIHLPGFLARAHAVAKSETLGIMLVVGGLLVYHRLGPGSTGMVVVIAIAMIANPTAVHALARAAAKRAEREHADPRPAAEEERP